LAIPLVLGVLSSQAQAIAAVPIRVVDGMVDPSTCDVDLAWSNDNTLSIVYPHAPTGTLRLARSSSCGTFTYESLNEQGYPATGVSVSLDSLGLLSAVYANNADPLGTAGLRYTLRGEAMFGLTTVAIPGAEFGTVPVYAIDSHDRPYVAFRRNNGEVGFASFNVRTGGWTVESLPSLAMTGLPGRFLAIAIDHQDRPVLAYYDQDGAIVAATRAAGGWSFRRQAVEPPPPSSGIALAVDSVDAPWVAVSTPQGVQVIRFTIIGVVTQTAVPGVVAEIGPHAMAIDGANRIRLGYYDPAAQSVCVATNDFGWTTTVVESGVTARSVSLTLTGTTRWAVAYCDAARNQAKAAGVGLWTSVPPDFECDGDVDADDLAHFEACATGPAVPQTDAACLDADFNHDGDVDQADFAVLQRCWTIEGQPVDLTCVP
jgi:hypothetical protein